jgi:hypothetical protein
VLQNKKAMSNNRFIKYVFGCVVGYFYLFSLGRVFYLIKRILIISAIIALNKTIVLSHIKKLVPKNLHWVVLFTLAFVHSHSLL